jgi:hypothetical protein
MAVTCDLTLHNQSRLRLKQTINLFFLFVYRPRLLSSPPPLICIRYDESVTLHY